LIFYYGLPLGFTDYEPTPPEWEMFDLAKDPEEMNNIYGNVEYAEIQDSLKQQLKQLQLDTNDEGLEFPELVEVYQEFF
jgi:N-acetylglucosamine-6-sulfatase